MDNSFSNVTKRKQQIFNNSLDETFIENDESLNSNIHSSLPDLKLRSYDLELTAEYKTKTDRLEIELLSAHQEIDNLNKENKELLDKLSELKKTVDTLKTLLNSGKTMTPKFSTAKKLTKNQRRNIALTKTNDTSLFQMYDINNTFNNSNTENKTINNKTIGKEKDMLSKEIQNQNITKKMEYQYTKHKITILADQQGIGLASVLLENRLN